MRSHRRQRTHTSTNDELSRHHHPRRRKDGRVALGGDGQVTIGDTVDQVAPPPRCAPLKGGKMLAGFAGSVADALTLFEKFEEKLDRYPGNLPRAAVELAKDWRSDRVLRRLEALLVVSRPGAQLPAERHRRADRAGRRHPRGRVRRQLRPRRRPRAAARCRRSRAREIVQRSLEIAADICVFTNRNITILEL